MIPRKVVSWLGISQFSSAGTQNLIYLGAWLQLLCSRWPSHCYRFRFTSSQILELLSYPRVPSVRLLFSFLSPCSPINSHNRINVINNCDPSVANKSFFQPLSAVEPTKEARDPWRFVFPCSLALLGTLKLSQTSPDVPNSEVGGHPHKDLPNAHSQQQVTSRSV